MDLEPDTRPVIDRVALLLSMTCRISEIYILGLNIQRKHMKTSSRFICILMVFMFRIYSAFTTWFKFDLFHHQVDQRIYVFSASYLLY